MAANGTALGSRYQEAFTTLLDTNGLQAVSVADNLRAFPSIRSLTSNTTSRWTPPP